MVRDTQSLCDEMNKRTVDSMTKRSLKTTSDKLYKSCFCLLKISVDE